MVLLTKGALADSNTYFAQGGISAVLDEPAPGDTVAAHIADTLKAGAGHCNPDGRPGALHRGAPGHRRARTLRRAL